MVVEKIVVGPLQENCYILGDEATGEGVIIDPGAEAGRIVAAVRRLELRVGKVITTHAHVDHIAAAQTVKEELGAKLCLHPAERMNLAGLLDTAIMFGLAEARVPTVDVDLSDGDVIPVGTMPISVTHTPGHSPGHCVLGVGEDLFCGDLIFAGSIGRTDLPGGDYDAMIASLERAILTLPDGTRLHPGHGEATTVAVERRLNPFLRGLKRRAGGGD